MAKQIIWTKKATYELTDILKTFLLLIMLSPLWCISQEIIIDISDLSLKHKIERLEIENRIYELDGDTTHINVNENWKDTQSLVVKVFVRKKEFYGSIALEKSYCPDKNITIKFSRHRKTYYFQEDFCSHKTILGQLTFSR